MVDDQLPTQPHNTDDIYGSQPTQPHPQIPQDEMPTIPDLTPYPAIPGEFDPPPENDGKRRKKKRRSRGCWGTIKMILAVGSMGLAAIIGVLAIAALIVYRSLAGEIKQDMTKLESLEGVEVFETSRIYDRNGELLYEVFNEGRRTEIPFEKIPFVVRWSSIATEDDSFYENPGFDPQSIARAILQWYQEGELVSGGSTITQQLVRQIVFSYEERNEITLRRKLKEAALAYVMTQQFTKDEILTIYLNEIYYGNLAYGIESASDVYFDKPATDLTLGEAAFLSGLVQSPATYDPYTNFDAAKSRQLDSLSLLVHHGYITQAEADAAFVAPPLTINDLASPDVSLVAPHFTVEARKELVTLPGIDPAILERGGLEIHTTLDLGMQNAMEEIVLTHVVAIRDQHNLTNAAMVVINPNTGEILALVGSIDYNDESIDGSVNVMLSPQQPGSTMKPLTYALALGQGWQASDIIWDVPMAYDTGVGAGFDYEPVNYDFRAHGPVRLRDALANSYNIPAVTLLREVGIVELLTFANTLGMDTLGDEAGYYGLSLTLGGGEVTGVGLTTAYSVFANGGQTVNPHFVNRVVDSDGNILYQADNQPGERIVDERVAFVISDILSDNRARTPAMGSESELAMPFPAAVKTGTTNDFRDNWTVGYTPHIAIGVWSGNTDNTPMAEGTSGLTGAAPIWREAMLTLYDSGYMETVTRPAGIPLRGEFPPPEGVERQPICYISSLRDPLPVEQGCKDNRSEWVILNLNPVTENEADLPTPTAAPPVDENGDPLLDEEGNPLPPPRIDLGGGLWVIAVISLDEESQAMVVETLSEVWSALPNGVDPDAPRYCEIPAQYVGHEGVSYQLFIEAPSNSIDAIWARNWAWGNDRPIVPGVICPVDVLEDQLAESDPVFDEATGATFSIESPKPGEEVYGFVDIIGSVAFDRSRVQYYKLEISGGNLDGWVTFGETHDESKQGVLEILHADALPHGDYTIRLVLVGVDGNFLPPVTIPIRIIAEPPPEG